MCSIFCHVLKGILKHFTPFLTGAALVLSALGAQAFTLPHAQKPDLTKLTYKSQNHRSALDSFRQKQIRKANAIMEAGRPQRFVDALYDNGAVQNPEPSGEFQQNDFFGDIDGPDGTLWYFSGKLEHAKYVHNEYFTEFLPQSFTIDIFDSNMNLVGTIKDRLELKEDEARVRQVEVLPVITRNYFNQDDSYEVAVSVLVNPKPWGIRPYTYIYQLNGKTETVEYDAVKEFYDNGDPLTEHRVEQHNVAVNVINGMIYDVCNASSGTEENIVMSTLNEGNDSGISEEEAGEASYMYGEYINTEDKSQFTEEQIKKFEEYGQKFWKFQQGNYYTLQVFAKADAKGELQKVLDKKYIYYQWQGNMQDDAAAITFVHNGKPAILFPHYEEMFYNPFYSNQEDISQRIPNKLIVDIYELNDIAKGFELVQSTPIDVVKSTEDGVIASYYSIGAFRYREDIGYGEDGKASFIVTRRDYLAGSDSEKASYFVYNPDGTRRGVLFEGADAHAPMADIEGFAPMELFISTDADGYWFNFMDLSTYKVELKLNYGLTDPDDPDSDPDYMMANVDRTPVGDSFMYVAEMRAPDYDDVNDVNFMRAVWLTRQGQVDHMDYINMGNKVQYAQLYLDSHVLQPNYYHQSPEQEYMMLIKRAYTDGNLNKTREELLIQQVNTESNPLGQQLMLLGPDDKAGVLSGIVPYYNPARLAVTYQGTNDQNMDFYTVRYYNLPLNSAGVADITNPADAPFTFDGTNIALPGENIDVFNLQGIRVAGGQGNVSLDGMAGGVYIVRAAGAVAKVVKK